ncbi:unnamed protein product [Trifolium pratense]|uniref:Uncharacterized protein n=1 Tax=Trifolium pratense TaxID=57577 RepID=A0ACB0K227_TRIPR|nr:unnamed protein product [Trifolium pratense]
MFIWDACKDLTLIILMVAAVASLALGIKSEGIKEGWYDGGSIAFAVFLVIAVTGINIVLVIRDGRRVEISIYDVVVGDVIPLNIGNQVPAGGILITGHSLAIDESSMTGESKIVNKHPKEPFLMSGCKVADGSGTMLVTAVGTNTEWGLLIMASISEDTGEETPLQVRLNGLATFIGIAGLTVAVVVCSSCATGQWLLAVPEGLPLAVTLTLAYSMKNEIGLAMGIQGTEVAKESSDIIILDDNFASVVKVVKWGRSVYANIQKFIQFQLTVNIAALVINTIASFSTGEVPLNTVQARTY